MWNKTWNVADDDWFAEDHATKDVADSSVGRLPHLLQAKLFNACFIRSNSCALNTNAMLLNCFSGIDSDLIIGCIAVFHAKVVVLKVDVEIRQDQLILDELPHNAGHLIAIELYNCAFYLDL